MPFNGAGIFTRIHNWIADRNAGIKIMAARMDEEMDDYTVAFSTTFLRNGIVPMQGNINMGTNTILGLGNGTAAAPAVRFSTDNGTGMYLSAFNELAFSVGGSLKLKLTTTDLQYTGNIAVTGNLTVSGTSTHNGAATFTQPVRISMAADGQNAFGVNGLSKGVRIVPLAGLTLIQGTDQTLGAAAPIQLEGTTVQINASAPGKGINVNASGDTTVQGFFVGQGGGRFQGADNVTLVALQGAANQLRFYSNAASGNIVDSTNAAGSVYAPYVLGGSTITLIAQPANKGIVIDSAGGVTATGTLSVTGNTGIGGVLDVTGSIVARAGVSIVTGGITISGQARNQDGTVGSPSIAFTNELGLGFYRKSAGVLSAAVGGVSIFDINSVGISMNGGISLNATAANKISITGVVSGTPDIGLRGKPQKFLGGDYTFGAGDNNCMIASAGGALALTVPLNATVPIPVGTEILIVTINGGGATSIAGQAGVSLKWVGTPGGRDGPCTLTFPVYATLTKVNTDQWYISGPGVS